MTDGTKPATKDTPSPTLPLRRRKGSEAEISVHARLARSRANGPGVRAVVWLQGCSRGCLGCFNPETHARDGRHPTPVSEIVRWLTAERLGIEGLSVSGGEPMEQAEGLLELVRRVWAETPLSVLLFSGYTREEIEAMPLGSSILACVDVLIDGPYDASRPPRRGLLGSANQRAHLLTPRYTAEDLARVPAGEAIVAEDGSVTISGVSPPRAARAPET